MKDEKIMTWYSDRIISLILSGIVILFIAIIFFIKPTFIRVFFGLSIIILYSLLLLKTRTIVISRTKIVNFGFIEKSRVNWTISIEQIDEITINTITSRFGFYKTVKLLLSSGETKKFVVGNSTIRKIYLVLMQTEYKGLIFLEDSTKKVVLSEDNSKYY
ncbi:MAG TPA: hypothetical protein PLP27_06830 [Crocinitomicaceae bacterium]|nr:hypothetical protein [Crocinitomicaceae bacterium]